jgi:hypothetical protein
MSGILCCAALLFLYNCVTSFYFPFSFIFSSNPPNAAHYYSIVILFQFLIYHATRTIEPSLLLQAVSLVTYPRGESLSDKTFLYRSIFTSTDLEPI